MAKILGIDLGNTNSAMAVMEGSEPEILVNAEGEKVKLKAVFIAHPLTQSVYDMEWLIEIEEEAGVDVEWEQIYTDWNQVKSTRFASGDIPDLLFNATGDSDYTTYDGLFMELTDLIDKYAPNVKKMFEEEMLRS